MAKLFDLFRRAPKEDVMHAGKTDPNHLASPFAPEQNHLKTIVWPNLFGLDEVPISREEAMTIPSVARARGLICTTIGRLPLIAYDKDEKPLPTQPLWTQSTSSQLPAYHKLLWTVDDLLFYGFSLWHIVRNGRGQILQTNRVRYDRWEFSDDGVTVDGDVVNDKDYILFYGVNEGILVIGQKLVRQYADLMSGAAKAARTPMAGLELHDTGDTPLTREEVDQLISDWATARRGDNGGVAYTNSSIELREHGAADGHLLIEGRNAAAVDVARLFGMPAALIDAVAQQGNLTYETTQDRIAEFIDFGLAPILAAISGRLSMDDVCPSGVTMGFDLEKVLGTNTPYSTKTADERIPGNGDITPKVDPNAAE